MNKTKPDKYQLTVTVTPLFVPGHDSKFVNWTVMGGGMANKLIVAIRGKRWVMALDRPPQDVTVSHLMGKYTCEKAHKYLTGQTPILTQSKIITPTPGAFVSSIQPLKLWPCDDQGNLINPTFVPTPPSAPQGGEWDWVQTLTDLPT